MIEFSNIVSRRLWAGPISSVRPENLEVLESEGLAVVVSILPIGRLPCDGSATQIRGVLAGRGLRHRIFITSDHDDQLDPEQIFRTLDDPGPTLIHCNAGQNRSTALAACWLLLHRVDDDPLAALNRVARIRQQALGAPPQVTKEMGSNITRFGKWLDRKRAHA